MTINSSYFYHLIPLSIAGFYFAYKIGRKVFFVPLVLDLPFLQKEATFKIVKEGKYCIWDKGKQFMKVPFDQFGFQIENLDTGQKIPLARTLLRPQQSGFTYASKLLYTFQAPAGNYKLEIVAGATDNSLEITLLTLQKYIPSIGRKFDPSKYFILIKNHFNLLWTLAFVWLIILSSIMLLVGLILPNAS